MPRIKNIAGALALALPVAILVALLHVTPMQAQTMSEEKIFGQYRLLHWTDVEGLPQNYVSSIAATSDGYLWVATSEGVARFDGVSFTTFGEKALKQASPDSKSLLVDRAGVLWISNRNGGVTQYKDHKFYVPALAQPMGYAFQMLEDRAGTVWLASAGRGLAFVRDGRWKNLTKQDGLPSDRVRTVAEDATGRLWIGTERGLAWLENGRIQTDPTMLPNVAITALRVDAKNNLWIGTEEHLWQRSPSQPTVLVERLQGRISSLYSDRQDRMWVGTREGVTLLQDGKASQHRLTPSDSVDSILEDSAGTIWLGTGRTGLYALREVPVSMFLPAAINGLDMRAVVQDRSGVIWLGTASRVFRKTQAGDVVAVPSPDRLSGITMAEDPKGGMWLSDRKRAYFLRDGKVAQVIDPRFEHNLISLQVERGGAVWLGSTDGGFCRHLAGKLQCLQDTEPDGRFTNSIFQEKSGAVWIATANGLFRWKEGTFEKFTTKDGLASNHTTSFYESKEGSLWIGGGDGGLSRFKDGRFARVTSSEGLFDNVAFGILDDGLGNLWMSSNRGIYRVNLAELEECADGRRKSVRSYSYGSEDGMLSREGNGATPAAWKAKDGTLWFATVRGPVMIDPKRIKNGRPPRVVIDEVQVDGQPVASLGPVAVGPSQGNLEIRYTVLQCLRPRAAHFKIKLEGLDPDWTDMGQSRSVRYFHLPPGNYSFRVIADDGEGNWNMTGATIPLSVTGPFYRTWWFQGLVVLLVGGGVAGAWYRHRRGLIQASGRQRDFLRKLIESQEQERRRLASELHDGLAQRLTLVKNLVILAGRAKGLGNDSASGSGSGGVAGSGSGIGAAPGAGTGNVHLDAIGEQAGEALREVREISHALRPYQLDYLGLKESLESLVKSVSLSGRTKVGCTIGELQNALSKDVQVQLYRIAQECLQNIFKHAQAKHARITLEQIGNQVYLTIADDGKGFVMGTQKAGLGLTSITERVELLDGKIEITSAPTIGTRIHISVAVTTKAKTTP